jgi:hypothetical protein
MLTDPNNNSNCSAWRAATVRDCRDWQISAKAVDEGTIAAERCAWISIALPILKQVTDRAVPNGHDRLFF